VTRSIPDWFELLNGTIPEIMERLGGATSSVAMSDQVRFAPMQAFWFLADSLGLANQANRDGMHANALALTRQCVEAIGVVELGLCGHVDAEAKLLLWDQDKLKPGQLRAWLEAAVWPAYGAGLWTEPWSTFMGEFAGAVQAYAHYGRSLAQWQSRLRFIDDGAGPDQPIHGVIEFAPRAYDEQKATRITLFHALLYYLLGRIWLAANPRDRAFADLMEKLGEALGRSAYLDGHQTDWGQQFWAMVWMRGGQTRLE